MDEELNLDLDTIESNVENKLKVKNRFEQLSEKVILTSKERDEKAQLAEKLQAENSSIAKERDFYKSFSQISSKHPEATNYQDQILERVNKGYDPEEAALAVLAKEGKLNTPTQAVQQTIQSQVEGGSAPTIQGGAKSFKDMTADEKFSALAELDKSGDLANALRGMSR